MSTHPCAAVVSPGFTLTSYHDPAMTRRAQSAPLDGDVPRRARRTPADRVVLAWRRLSGGSSRRDEDRRTLVACSGGADSAALAISLAGAKSSSVVVAYVAHDIREGHVVAAEREHVRALAAKLGCDWASANVSVASLPGNLEANARRARYAALGSLAIANGCQYAATGHQATDQLETLLMRLMRGTGPNGLRGIAERKSLTSGVTLIRPMLGITREEAEAICAGAGYVPLVDATNADQSLLRNAVRAQVIPVLRELSPGIESRVSQTARVAVDASKLIDQALEGVSDRCSESSESEGVCWNRQALKAESAASVRWLLWRTLRSMAQHPDGVNFAAVQPIVQAIRSGGEHRKVWVISAVNIEMTSRSVTCCRQS